MFIKTFTYGKIPIEIWEIPLLFFLLILVFFVSKSIQKNKIKLNSGYRFFLWGLWAKIAGGLAFGAIYVFYYGGGDTTSFYECSLAFSNLFTTDFTTFLEAYFGDGSQETKSLFTSDTGSPMWYMFRDDKTRIVMKLIVPFLLLGFKSYFIATFLVSIVTYGGLWQLYLMFTRHFPQYRKALAIGILFMPSVIFWGSGILKDSFTLAATCYFIVATDRIISRSGNSVIKWVMLIAAGYIILLIKPYILIILLPGTMVWYFYAKIRKIKNHFFRYIIVPFIYLFIIAGSYGALTTLGSSLGKFAPDKALSTAVIIQNDLQSEHYEGRSFDIGEFEATPLSIASKFPAAVTAGLFRPFIFEAGNVVMLLSGLENLFMLAITLFVLFTMKPKVIYQLVVKNPLIMYSFVFAVFFAFMIGVTTSNFGALVRFKIPLIPLYMASIMIIYGHLRGIKVSKTVTRRKTLR
jgi:hypothetical protein